MPTAEKLLEQIEAAQAEIRQKENQLKELKQRQKDQEAKERAHRLIERGGIFESLIDNAKKLTNEQVKVFLAKTITTDFARKILMQIKEPNIIEVEAQAIASQGETDEATGENGESVRTTPDEREIPS